MQNYMKKSTILKTIEAPGLSQHKPGQTTFGKHNRYNTSKYNSTEKSKRPFTNIECTWSNE